MRDCGEARKANVGISNDNVSEKLTHRKTKVSRGNVNRPGVSRGLRIRRELMPMHNGLIFPYYCGEVMERRSKYCAAC